MQIFRCSQLSCAEGARIPRISQLRGLGARPGRAEGYFYPYSCIIFIFFERDNVPHREETTTRYRIAIQDETIYPFQSRFALGLPPARRDSSRPWHPNEMSEGKKKRNLFSTFPFSIRRVLFAQNVGEKEIGGQKLIRSRCAFGSSFKEVRSLEFIHTNTYTCEIDFRGKFNRYILPPRFSIYKNREHLKTFIFFLSMPQKLAGRF